MTKSEWATMAIEHHNKMLEKYSSDIKHSIKNSRVYKSNIFSINNIPVKPCECKIYIFEECAQDSIVRSITSSMGSIGVLNFADYINAGGTFLQGSTAQEESLCHDSILYEVLSGRPDYYDYNAKHINMHLYEDRALYTPDIIFEFNDNNPRIDVISCAAPNLNKCLGDVSELHERELMYKRWKLILHVAADNNIDTLIVGAWGTGVFGVDTRICAQTLTDAIFDFYTKYGGSKTVIIAIPDKEKIKIFTDEVNKKFYLNIKEKN